MPIPYSFKAAPWKYAGAGAWYFVSLPVKMAKEIRTALRQEEEGWGRLKATARIGNSEWKTAIWFDTKSNTYLLPLKAEIRKKEQLDEGKTVKVVVMLWVAFPERPIRLQGAFDYGWPTNDWLLFNEHYFW